MISPKLRHRLRLRARSRTFRFLETTLATTSDRSRAERSRLTWRQEIHAIGDEPMVDLYRLTILGVLNALFGLEVQVMK